jgi:serine/threonine-protein kinase
MVTSEGQIKIADFWVAGAVASQQSVRQNTLMSSIHYTAPEVAEGKPATPASDVYSLGIILFELLTAVVPFDGETPLAIALKHAREQVPSMRTYNPAVPKALEGIVARALQKEPEDRFRSIKSMLNELKSAREALNLNKQLVWSESTDARDIEPALEAGEKRSRIDQIYPTWALTFRKALIALVAILFVVVVIGAVMLINVPTDVRLPDLVGKKYEDAQSLVKQYKVQLITRTEEYNESYPEGVIYYMSPGAGRTIKSGKSVDVWVSKGSRFSSAPNLAKLSLEDARQRITESGLSIGEVSQDYSAAIPEGSIISQKPGPGTRLERGKSVSLIYSLGPKPIEIPSTTPDQIMNPGDASSDGGDTGQVQSELGKSRSFEIKFTVPNGPEDQIVEIGVEDDNGARTAYSEVKHPGDKIKETIDVVGSPAIVRIYIDKKLIKEERK